MIDEYEGGINAFLDPSKRIKGISTGFTKLDEKTGGLHAGDLFIMAARPSMGKTALALNIAQHVATQRRTAQTVAIFSLEMSQESLLTRMLCAAARVDSQKFRAGFLNCRGAPAVAGRAASRTGEAPLYIDDTAGINLMDMHAKLRRLQSRAWAGPGDHRLSAVDGWPRPLRKSQPGSQRALARHETAGQGTECAHDRALAAQPRVRKPGRAIIGRS